jgi:hypothetical protein
MQIKGKFGVLCWLDNINIRQALTFMMQAKRAPRCWVLYIRFSSLSLQQGLCGPLMSLCHVGKDIVILYSYHCCNALATLQHFVSFFANSLFHSLKTNTHQLSAPPLLERCGRYFTHYGWKGGLQWFGATRYVLHLPAHTCTDRGRTMN